MISRYTRCLLCLTNSSHTIHTTWCSTRNLRARSGAYSRIARKAIPIPQLCLKVFVTGEIGRFPGILLAVKGECCQQTVSLDSAILVKVTNGRHSMPPQHTDAKGIRILSRLLRQQKQAISAWLRCHNACIRVSSRFRDDGYAEHPIHTHPP